MLDLNCCPLGGRLLGPASNYILTLLGFWHLIRLFIARLWNRGVYFHIFDFQGGFKLIVEADAIVGSEDCTLPVLRG